MTTEEGNYSPLTQIFCMPKDLEEELEWKEVFKKVSTYLQADSGNLRLI